jgi:hypothetical protein
MTTDADYRQSTWALARLADCAGPDRPDHHGLAYVAEGDPDPSPGAILLRHVENGARELYERVREDYVREVPSGGDPDDWGDYLREAADYNGDVHEIADSAPPVYTSEMWGAFVDLAAYEEDPVGEGLTDGTDLAQSAAVALYMIADRLAWALLAEWAEGEA